jgi:Protein of unknown function (DUF2997)
VNISTNKIKNVSPQHGRMVNIYSSKKQGVGLCGEAWNGGSNTAQSSGAIEQIEFKIYPDGRVEEKVRGIKGGNCHKVTEKINEQLGKVVKFGTDGRNVRTKRSRRSNHDQFREHWWKQLGRRKLLVDYLL